VRICFTDSVFALTRVGMRGMYSPGRKVVVCRSCPREESPRNRSVDNRGLSRGGFASLRWQSSLLSYEPMLCRAPATELSAQILEDGDSCALFIQMESNHSRSNQFLPDANKRQCYDTTLHVPDAVPFRSCFGYAVLRFALPVQFSSLIIFHGLRKLCPCETQTRDCSFINTCSWCRSIIRFLPSDLVPGGQY
jgi:hypothetical protein